MSIGRKYLVSGVKAGTLRFSLVQSMQTSVTGLNVGIKVFKNFKDIVGLFSSRKWVDKVHGTIPGGGGFDE